MKFIIDDKEEFIVKISLEQGEDCVRIIGTDPRDGFQRIIARFKKGKLELVPNAILNGLETDKSGKIKVVED